MKHLINILFFLPFSAFSQLEFNSKELELGVINEAFEIGGDIVLKNGSTKKIYLLRADAERGLKVFASKKTLLPNDTCLLVISFIPESEGRFNKRIKLVSSDRDTPYALDMSGDLKRKLKNDQQACYYFGSKKRNSTISKESIVVVKENEMVRDNSNQIPDHSIPPRSTHTNSINKDKDSLIVIGSDEELSLLHYKPNNIVFLVDVSSSMKDSLKLPVLKEASKILIKALRDIDNITLITYADSVKVLAESIKGSDKSQLNEWIDNLYAQGYTKGRKAIYKAREIAERHFIKEGNNQVFLITDGLFYFYDKDKEEWKRKNADKRIIISTVGLGNDKAALKNLKEIAEAGEGSFIRIKKKHGSEEQLLDEVKLRSKR